MTEIIQSFSTVDKKTKEMLFDLLKAMVAANIKIDLPKKNEITEVKHIGQKESVRPIGRKKVPGNSH